MAKSPPAAPYPDIQIGHPNVVAIDSPDGRFVVFSRRDLRNAIADAINEAKRTSQTR